MKIYALVKIKKSIKIQKISRTDFCKNIGIKLSTLRALEKGSLNFDANEMVIIAKYFKLPLSILCEIID